MFTFPFSGSGRASIRFVAGLGRLNRDYSRARAVCKITAEPLLLSGHVPRVSIFQYLRGLACAINELFVTAMATFRRVESMIYRWQFLREFPDIL